MKIKVVLFFLAFFILSGCNNPSLPSNNIQNNETKDKFCDYINEECHEKVIQITATYNEGYAMSNHPIISFDKKQSYWSTDFGQTILISDVKIDCQEEVFISGVLKENVGPCSKEVGTRNSYCGTAIEVESWQCQ